MKAITEVTLIICGALLAFSVMIYPCYPSCNEFANIKLLPDEEKEVIEKIPLYYDIDNPNKTYTRGEKGEFIEIDLNG